MTDKKITPGKISGIHRNILGTISFDGRFAGMRKAQEFIVYPIPAGAQWDGLIDVQSDTRFGEIHAASGLVLMCPPKSSGAYAVTLALAKMRREVQVSQLSPEDLAELLAAIGRTASPSAGSHGVITDNSGAARFATATA